MKINVPLSLASALLVLFSCSPHRDAIEINENKPGGLYELAQNGKQFKSYNSDESYLVDTTTFISFADFHYFEKQESDHEGTYSFNFQLTDEGTLKFKEMTGRNISKQICFIIGDKVVIAPIVQGIIPNGMVSVTIVDEKAAGEIIEFLKK